MNTAWLMAGAVGVCNGGVALAGKAAERSRCRAMPFCLVTFGVAGVAAWLTTVGHAAAWGEWKLWAFGGGMGALYVAAIGATLLANACWPPSIVVAAANMAFVAPIFLSALFLGEPLCWLDAVIVFGVIVLLAGLADPSARHEGDADSSRPHPAPWKRWSLLAAIFASNGALMMGYKLFGRVVAGQPPGCLVVAFYGSGCVMAAVIMAARGCLRISRAEAGCGLASGVSSGLAALALLGAMRLPAAAAFPVVQGSSLLASVLLCALVFREALTTRKLVALAAGLGAMALTPWR